MRIGDEDRGRSPGARRGFAFAQGLLYMPVPMTRGLQGNANGSMPRVGDTGLLISDWEVDRLPVNLLLPFTSEQMELTEANPEVGSVRNNGPEMLRAVHAAEDGELPL